MSKVVRLMKSMRSSSFTSTIFSPASLDLIAYLGCLTRQEYKRSWASSTFAPFRAAVRLCTCWLYIYLSLWAWNANLSEYFIFGLFFLICTKVLRFWTFIGNWTCSSFCEFRLTTALPPWPAVKVILVFAGRPRLPEAAAAPPLA